jgi:hypothetical protein
MWSRNFSQATFWTPKFHDPVHIFSKVNSDDILLYYFFKFSEILSLYTAHISDVEAIRQVMPVQIIFSELTLKAWE